MRYFFYGTLMDPQVLRVILRRSVNASSIRPAVLTGYRRVFRSNASYPVLVPDTTASVDGTLVSGLTTRDANFLRVYEGPDYQIVQLPVRLAHGAMVISRVFLPIAACAASTTEWTFEGWRRRFRAHYVRRINRSRQAPAAAN